MRASRRNRRFTMFPSIACDMGVDVREDDWLPRLAGVDAVVNAAGILREHGSDHFDNVHHRAPLALFRACRSAGIRRVVQLSALGDPADGEFIASKHRGDGALLELDLDAIVLRPSIVYSAAGSYGGTSLLRALAALPGVLLLPEGGAQRLQPVALEDLGTLLVAALDTPVTSREPFEVVGPDVLMLSDYLRCWRSWLGSAPALEIRIPSALVRSGAALGEFVGRGPLGLTMLRMLERGNVGRPDAWARLRDEFGVAPRALDHVLATTPAQTQDRWHARLYFALPALRLSFALLWVGSGLIGLSAPVAAVESMSREGPLALDSAVGLARLTGAADLLLGVLCLSRWQPKWVLAAMLAMLVGYTLSIGVLWPRHWFDPLGGLAKNIPLIIALCVLLAIEDRR
ncbi:MAG: SDR family oxidoreductase [Dokdonella sp.]|uniref:SDR family oxidoreductase n=1 Tax=Dokdonella sp. TaxID=2291710 RepID=UPI0032655501